MADQELSEAARALLDLCRGKRLTLAAAESCTGGLLAATLTEIPDSSDVFERGFVTYSNEAKSEMLGVTPMTLAGGGAVPGKPVGLVYLAAASRSGRLIAHERKYGDIGRAQVRRACVIEALAMLGELAASERARPPRASG